MESTGKLVAVGRLVFFYYCVFVVIFLICVYAFIGTFLGMIMSSKTTSASDDADVAKFGVMVSGIVTVFATMGLCIYYYFYTVTIKYAAYKAKD